MLERGVYAANRYNYPIVNGIAVLEVVSKLIFVQEYFSSDIVGKETVNGIEIKYDENEYSHPSI